MHTYAMAKSAPTQLRDLLRDIVLAEASGRTVLIDKIKRLLRSGRPLEALEVSPFDLSQESRVLHSPSVRDVLVIFEAFGNTARSDDSQTSALAGAISGYLRTRCVAIADWLEFLLPTNNYLDLPLAYHAHVLQPMSQMLAGLFHLKAQLMDALAAVPHLYKVLFSLWLHLQPYITSVPQDVTHQEIYRCTEFAIRDAIRIPGVADATKALDNLAAECALDVVKHRPRRFYKLAVRCIPRLMASGVEQTFVEAHLNAIMLYAAQSLRMQSYPREVVRTIVETLRALQERPDGQTAASYACQILMCIWCSADPGDRRTLVWAVQNGVLPLLLTLGKTHKDEFLAVALRFVSSRTTQVDVLKALCRKGGVEHCSFRAASVCFPYLEGAIAMDLNLQERTFLLNRFFGKTCAYGSCPSKPDESRSNMYRCSKCLHICYCSKECQRADWLVHNKDNQCSRLDIQVLSGNICTLDALFAITCAKSHVCRNAQKLLDELAHPHNAPFTVAFYRINVNLMDMLQTHEIAVHQQGKQEFPETWCLVTATVSQDMAIDREATVRVMDLSLAAFKAYLSESAELLSNPCSM